MKFQLFILGCWVLQSIYGSNISDEISKLLVKIMNKKIVESNTDKFFLFRFIHRFKVYPPDVASTRIVGGADAPDGAAPFQCSLQISKSHNCGCSILSNQWLLTASHCVMGRNPQSLDILVGTNDLKNGGTYYKVEKFIMHEQYNRPQFANDVAVIRVQGEIEFNDRVQPIEPMKEEIEDGTELQLTGWGRLSVMPFNR